MKLLHICTNGLRYIVTSTTTARQTCIHLPFVYRCVPAFATRSFYSFGLPKETPSIKTKRKPSKKRWKSDPVLEEKFASILRKALHESIDDAIDEFEKLKHTSDCALPDWMIVKMSSVLVANGNWDGAKQILDAQYLITGANQRFARNASVEDHQIASALERILGGGDDRSYDLAKKFYMALIDLRFCALKDIVLKIFMQFFIGRNEIHRAVQELSELLTFDKPRSISGALFIVMRAAYRSSDQRLLNQVNDLLDRYISSRLQRTCMHGCVMLAEGQPLQFAQRLHNEEYSFGGAEVNYLCEFAVHNKEPKILESLIEIPDLFKLNEKARNVVYGSLANCYGKAKDVDGLSKTWGQLKTEKEMDCFIIAMQKLAHFYRCLNVVAPADLTALIKKLNE